MVLLTNIAAIIGPWILRNAINYLQSGEVAGTEVFFYAVSIVLMSLVEGSFRYLMRRILIGLSRWIEYDLRNDLFAHLQKLSSPFYQKHSTGDLMARATNDLGAVRAVLGPGVMYSINTLFNSVIVVSVLVSINFKLSVITLLPLVGVSACVQFFGKRIHKRFEAIQEQFSWLTTLTQENVSGIRVVKAYNQEKAFIRRFKGANEDYINKSLALVRIWGTFQPLLTLLLGFSLVGLIWYGGLQVMRETITVGDFVAFIAYLSMLTWPTIALGYVINVFERGSASMQRINQLFDATPEANVTGTVDPFPIKGAIRVKDLTFAYNGAPVLSDLNLEIHAGETVAIVGRTGSGKSTLMNLLCRLYTVSDGTIFYDGKDINQIPISELRERIGYVPQDVFLFSDTIHGNIAFGKPDSEVSRVEEAARTSNVLSDIRSFPDQFQTFVGERGITLSGGQKQRIAISRALLIDPTILILDDSLSAVDTQTEEQILSELSNELAARTAILISHRISTLRMADRILVLDRGSFVEQGTHDQLLRLNGLYANLCRMQQLRAELEIE
jgi:ATP-binding cassette subfamily B protein